MKWEKVKFGDFCHIKHGFAFKSKFFAEEGDYIVTTPGHFHEKGGFRDRKGKQKYYIGEFPNDYILKENDLIIAMTEQGAGLLGSSILVPKDEQYLHNQRLGLVQITDNQLIDKFFLYYLFNTFEVRHFIAASATGTKVKHTSPKRIYAIEVSLPPIPIQQKIASILSAYDDLIENNLQRIQLLEETAQNLYREWFLDFRFPEHEEVEIVEGVPKGWATLILENVTKIVKGKKPKQEFKHMHQNTIPYLLVDVLERREQRYAEDDNMRKSEFGQAIMLMDGSRSGKVYRGISGAIGSTLAVYKVTDSRITNEYLYNFLKNREQEIKSKNTGSAIPHANKSYILKMPILIPNTKLLQVFTSKSNKIYILIENLHTQNQRLKEAKDILLPRLMNGSIEVSVD